MRHSVWTKSLLPEEDFVTFQEEEDKKYCSVLMFQEEKYWSHCVLLETFTVCILTLHCSQMLSQEIFSLQRNRIHFYFPFARRYLGFLILPITPTLWRQDLVDVTWSPLFSNEFHSSNTIVFIQVVQNCWCALEFTEYSSLWNRTNFLNLFFPITIFRRKRGFRKSTTAS